MPEHIGYLTALGLDYGWGPTSLMQYILEHVHVYTGLPWWASIALTGLIVRAALFKPSLTASEHSAKLAELRKNPRFSELQAQMMSAVRDRSAGGTGAADVQIARREMKMMQRAAGVQMWRTFVPFLAFPVGIGMFRLLRGMAALPVPGMETGGLAWFADLTVPDPFFVLPLASAGIMWWIFKQNLPFLPPANRPMMKGITYIMIPLSVVVTLYLPAGLQWFFLFSAVLQFLQSWLYRQPWLRRWARLGPLPRILKEADAGAALKVSGIATGVRESWDSVKQKRQDYVAKTQKKTEMQAAQEYEERRALEERENYYARRAAAAKKKKRRQQEV